MSVTMRECLIQLRQRLNEIGPIGNEWFKEGRWRNNQLRRYINEGMRDVARRSQFFKQVSSVALTPGTSEYLFPNDVLAVHQVWYEPGDGRKIPLAPRAYNSLDQIWGSRQELNQGEPSYYTTFGKSPLLKLKLYPVPSVASSDVSFYGSFLPAEINVEGTGDTTALELPEAWVDLVVTYAEYQARRVDTQANWQEAKALYEQHLDAMMVMLEGNTIFEEVQSDYSYAGIPGWLADPGYYGW